MPEIQLRRFEFRGLATHCSDKFHRFDLQHKLEYIVYFTVATIGKCLKSCQKGLNLCHIKSNSN